MEMKISISTQSAKNNNEIRLEVDKVKPKGWFKCSYRILVSAPVYWD